MDMGVLVEWPEPFFGHLFSNLGPGGGDVVRRLGCGPCDGAEDLAWVPQPTGSRVRPKVTIARHVVLGIELSVPGTQAFISQKRTGVERIPFQVVAVHFEKDFTVARAAVLEKSQGPRRQTLELLVSHSDDPGCTAHHQRLLTRLSVARGRVELLQ